MKTSIAQLAQRYNLIEITSKGELEYEGPNPFEPGAQEDGFHLFGSGEFKGSAFDRKIKRHYTSKQVADFAGIPYEEYEGFESHPNPGLSRYQRSDRAEQHAIDKAFAAAEKYDNRTLEERGLSAEARRNFEINYIASVESGGWGPYYIWPTYMPDGTKARSRRKFRYPERQLESRPEKKPRKSDWCPRGKEMPMPQAYGMNLIEGHENVWLVNSELAVWLFWQEGVSAICPLGEGRAIGTFASVFKTLKEKGAKCIHVLLDNDLAGYTAAFNAYCGAEKAGLEVVVYDLTTAPKKGFDASDLWEHWNTNQRSIKTFERCLSEQEVAPIERVKSWRENVKETLHEEKLPAMLDSTGKAISQGFRKCPKCHSVTVIKSDYKDGWLCWEKAGGCGATFEKDNADIKAQKPEKVDQATILLGLIEGCQLFHTPDGGRFVVIEKKDRKITYDIHGTEFKEWVSWTYLRKFGTTVQTDAIAQMRNTLASMAKFEGPKMNSYVRSAYYAGKFYIDLANEMGECVEVDEKGWRIITNPPIFFRRPGSMMEMPRPIPSGDGPQNRNVWKQFRDIINIGSDENWTMLVSWMITALIPALWPCPILSIHGEQGTAKSTMCRFVRQIVDPNEAFMISYVKEEKDVVIAAEQARVFALDNQTNIAPWLSNLICAMVTGSPYQCRKLYSDDGAKIFNSQPAVILNGIPEKFGGSDLNDRALKIHLPALASVGYKKLSNVDRVFYEIRPAILAAIFDAMSMGLRNMDNQDIIAGLSFPRMADFAEWVTRCEPALPWDEGGFHRTYIRNVMDSAQSEVEDLFSRAIVELVNRAGSEVTYLTTDLYNALLEMCAELHCDRAALADIENEKHFDEHAKARARNRLIEQSKISLERNKAFPKDGQALGTWLTRATPSLRKAMGIECVRGKRTSKGQLWIISKGAHASIASLNGSLHEPDELSEVSLNSLFAPGESDAYDDELILPGVDD